MFLKISRVLAIAAAAVFLILIVFKGFGSEQSRALVFCDTLVILGLLAGAFAPGFDLKHHLLIAAWSFAAGSRALVIFISFSAGMPQSFSAGLIEALLIAILAAAGVLFAAMSRPAEK